jgi:3-methyladenine DNA glycosylase/8-oxoguanine DNA glycosylase
MMAMSATLATTLFRCTSRTTVPRNAGTLVFDVNRDDIETVSASGSMATQTLAIQGDLDLRRSLAPLAHGYGDPTIRSEDGRVWRATRTPEGPAVVALIHEAAHLRVEAFGPGADRAIADTPRLLGLDEAPEPIPSGHPVVGRLVRRYPGVRIPRSGAILESLVPAILEQKVTGLEASRAWRGLIRVHGEAAPGPAEWRLRLGPTASTLAALPYYAYHPFGIERRRAELIRRVAARAGWFEAIVDLPLPDAYARLMAVPGIGPWTAAEVAARALGDADAVSIGDFHLPNLVTFALAGEPRGTDERMLELLEPFRGQRARVMRLLELSDIRPPRRGPRLSIRGIEDR